MTGWRDGGEFDVGGNLTKIRSGDWVPGCCCSESAGLPRPSRAQMALEAKCQAAPPGTWAAIQAHSSRRLSLIDMIAASTSLVDPLVCFPLTHSVDGEIVKKHSYLELTNSCSAINTT